MVIYNSRDADVWQIESESVREWVTELVLVSITCNINPIERSKKWSILL